MMLGMLDARLVLGVTGLCTGLYQALCRLFPGRSCEWHCRSVTVLHALTVTLLGLWCAFIEGPWPFSDAGGSNTPSQVIVISICLGYFLFDFGWCILFQTEGLTMMMHHSLSIVGLTWCLVVGKYGTEMVATIVGTEVSNPLLQLRWYLRETKNYETIWGEMVDLAFMATFGIMRIGFGSYLLYCYYQQPTDIYGRLGGTCIYLISWAFWVNIVQFAIYKYSKMFRLWRGKARGAREGTGSSRSGSPPPSPTQRGDAVRPPTSDTSKSDTEAPLPQDVAPVSQGMSSSSRKPSSGQAESVTSSEVVQRKAALGASGWVEKAEVNAGGGVRFNGLLTCQNGGGVVEQMLHDVESVVSSGGISAKKEA